jgi:hypothetical protein
VGLSIAKDLYDHPRYVTAFPEENLNECGLYAPIVIFKKNR